MKTPLSAKVLKRFIEIALEKLEGDWVILGGTLPPALGIDYRQTVDIDFAPVHASTNATSIKVMEIAEGLGLPVETINASAEFFLKKAARFKSRLVPLFESKRCRIFRPTLDLYIELKLNRGSESDFSDCGTLIDYAKEQTLFDELSAAKKRLQKMMGKSRRSGELRDLLLKL